jgi:ADP-ribose pyrophosphatase
MKSKKEASKKTAPAAANHEPATAASDSVPAKAAKTNPYAKAAKPARAAAVTQSKKAAKAGPAAVASKAPAASSKPEPEAKPKGSAKASLRAGKQETATLLDSHVVYEGKLFRVLQDHILEPGGREAHRDVIRHNGSVVILAVDSAKRKKDPWIVIERQYRHAAGQFLWELPAGKLDGGEAPMEGAKRELAEETGYSAKKWSPLVEYFASPGFLGESMKVFLAEGLIAGDAHPEADEQIDFRLVKLSDVLELVDKGQIIDGKTLTTILLYARQLGLKRKK